MEKKFYCGEYKEGYGWTFHCHYFRKEYCVRKNNFVKLEEENGGYKEIWYSQGFYDSHETERSKWVNRTLYVPHEKCGGKKALKRKK